jgi:aspartyl-tRNA(Asn)/glutamyl-tRNA(Gln) amidotransferase subunit C
MSSPFTRADVLRIAALARLELDDAEAELFAGQLAEILAYADVVRNIDTTGVAPMSHAADDGGSSPAREDVPTPSLDRADALAGAPDADPRAGLFRVPKVL